MRNALWERRRSDSGAPLGLRVAAVGVAGVALTAALVPSTSGWTIIGSATVAGAAGLLAAARSRGRMRLAWLLLSLPLLAYAAGDLARAVAGASPTPAWPAILDAVALAPLVIAVLIYPVLAGTRGRRRLVALDAAVVVLAVASLIHTLALGEVLAADDSLHPVRLVLHPWAEGLLASLALVALLRARGRPRPDVLLIGLTFLAYATADTAAALSVVRGVTEVPDWIGTLEALAPLPLAGAALLTAYTTTTSRRPLDRSLTGLVALLVPDLAAVLALCLALVLAPDDVVSHLLAIALLVATGVRQVAQTASHRGLQGQLARRVAERGRELDDLAAHHRRVDEQQSQFVSSVSHELRTPLTAIRGSLEMLRDGDAGSLTAEATGVVTVAVRATERLGRLVDDLIDLERLASADFGLTISPTALGPLVEHAAALLHPLAEERGVRIVDRLPAEATWVAGDADRLLQVLVNLVGNALKYAPEDTEVTVRVELAGEGVCVSVADRGRGIPEDEIDHVFDRFHQVSPADDRRRGGSGLGLAICQAIVTAHGGRIWVENHDGAVFCFTLPATSAPGHHEQPPAALDPEALWSDRR